ncbi:carbon-nitrogen hydrolase family protein [Sphingorhabdus soli]|uniref:Carbon-nitrogen hydrolase family protein n=1 Tax=Flavisphingopyxis soli TaxID=2601267 RepID=A0A5C6UMG6_9SPHN|nr:carbon-nitrogen hydrolase family protein [Sphingorhabdus soli]TXC73286.1 carbon-nitrogen hydrolase family protein [Sphingorhabdus soli]
MRIALLQMTSGIDPVANTAAIVDAIGAAKRGGADMLFAPEMAVLLDSDRVRSASGIVVESDSDALKAICDAARDEGIWVHPGSLPLLSEGDEGRRVNRSFVIDNTGKIRAHYDKIHRFDVTLASGESWRESNVYDGGTRAVAVDTPWGGLGLAICYDLRFPALFDALGNARCDMIALPSAFTVPTGREHWHVLIRARAIESACFMIAPAQTGEHEDGRRTYGHSLVVDPWGRVALDMGEEAGLGFADIDMQLVADARAQIPVLDHRRTIGEAEIY